MKHVSDDDGILLFASKLYIIIVIHTSFSYNVDLFVLDVLYSCLFVCLNLGCVFLKQLLKLYVVFSCCVILCTIVLSSRASYCNLLFSIVKVGEIIYIWFGLRKFMEFFISTCTNSKLMNLPKKSLLQDFRSFILKWNSSPQNSE